MKYERIAQQLQIQQKVCRWEILNVNETCSSAHDEWRCQMVEKLFARIESEWSCNAIGTRVQRRSFF